MTVGFTGSRSGMTPEQREACATLLRDLAPIELHHGDAVGADAEAHAIATAQGIRVVVHPPVNPAHRAFSSAADVRDELEYMPRNRAIVDETDVLIAAPRLREEESRRSGTWRTIRYARSVGRPVTIISADGSLD